MTEKAAALHRPEIITQAPIEQLITVLGQNASILAIGPSNDRFPPDFASIDPWDVVWELSDRIHSMDALEGDMTRHALFEIVRREAIDRHHFEVEAMAILFQTIGEQEQRWHPERTVSLEDNLPEDIQSHPGSFSGLPAREVFHLRRAAGMRSVDD